MSKSKNLSSTFMDFVFIVSLSGFFLKLILDGYLTQEEGSLALFSLVICFAIFRNPNFRKISMTAVSIAFLAIKYSNGNTEIIKLNILAILCLGLALFGIYKMIRGLFS